MSGTYHRSLGLLYLPWPHCCLSVGLVISISVGTTGLLIGDGPVIKASGLFYQVYEDSMPSESSMPSPPSAVSGSWGHHHVTGRHDVGIC